MCLYVVKTIAVKSKSFDFSSFLMCLTVSLAKIAVIWTKVGLLWRGQRWLSGVGIPAVTVTPVLGMDGRFPCSSSDGKYHPITVIPAEAALYEPHQGQWWLSSPGLVMVILFLLLLSSVPHSSITPLRGTLLPGCTVTACCSPSRAPALVLLKEIAFSERYHRRGSL